MAAKKGFHVRDDFRDYAEFIARVTSGVSPWTADRSSRRPNDNWYGASWSENLELLRKGWTEGRSRLHQHVEALRLSDRRGFTPRRDYDVAGACPNVPRYVAGDPYHMITPRLTQAMSTPVVAMIVSVSASAIVDPAHIMNRGAAIVSIIDRLEQDGISVELTASLHATRGDDAYTITLPLKAAGDHLDIDRIAYVLAHPAMLRRSCFALYETHAELEAWSGHYGTPSDIPARDRDGSVYFPAMFGSAAGYSAPEEALATVEQMVRAHWDSRDQPDA